MIAFLVIFDCILFLRWLMGQKHCEKSREWFLISVFTFFHNFYLQWPKVSGAIGTALCQFCACLCPSICLQTFHSNILFETFVNLYHISSKNFDLLENMTFWGRPSLVTLVSGATPGPQVSKHLFSHGHLNMR